MDYSDGKETGAEPEVKAIIHSLVAALGGPSGSDDGRYVLGDDALAVLKDIKKWLNLFDEKQNRRDVARSLAEANLVKGDLLEILALWPDDASEHSFKAKVALYCVDLLTQLTWPVEKNSKTERQTTIDQYFHIPYLKSAQAAYKRAILHHDTTKILRTAIRICLPAMAQPQRERSPRDDNIIKVVLYFIRNIVAITEPEGLQLDENSNDISRSATIDALHSQNIFDLLLTTCSNMSEEFVGHDVEVLEILFHLLKGIDVERLFMEKDELISSNTKDFQALINKEKGMLAGYARNQPSRHNRFGTMLWVKGGDNQLWTVSGQKALKSEEVSLIEIDKSKKWKKPRTGRKPELTDLTEIDATTPLTGSARRHLRRFVEDFLDSSFNPLFGSIRRSIEREATNVLDIHPPQYFYLVSWFLRAECVRRKKQSVDKTAVSQPAEPEVESFALVASVLNQETFVLLGRHMQRAQDEKNWQELNPTMRCFTQILLTVHEMSESQLEEDQDISENILNRIFYEQSTHDRIIALLRTFKGQGFGYLDACTELAHVFIRLLENYSKQNADMQIRSRRRARKTKKASENLGVTDAADSQEDQAMEAEDLVEAQRTTSERKFDFTKFAAKIVNQSSVETFIAFLRYFEDLGPGQLKRVHRFLYRIAFKMDLSVYLFRLDIIALFNRLIKGPEGLDLENPSFKEWEELIRHIFRLLGKKVDARPELGVELLFSKIPSTIFYLEYGYHKETAMKATREPPELEVRPGMDHAQQIGVIVSVLIDQTKSDILAWIKEVTTSALDERKAWEERASASANMSRPSDSLINDTSTPIATTEIQHPRSFPVYFTRTSFKAALGRDKYVRLLVKLLGWDKESLDENMRAWVVPPAISATQLAEDLKLIKDTEDEPRVYENGQIAEDFLQRKVTEEMAERRAMAAEERREARTSDSEGESGDEILFPAGGPTARQSSRSPAAKQRRLRNKHQLADPLDDAILDERRKARALAQDEKLRKIKSALYVHESDDETDEERDLEFFRMEESRRRKAAQGLGAVRQDKLELNNGKRHLKRKSLGRNDKGEENDSDASDSSESSAEDAVSNLPRRKRVRRELIDSDDGSEIEAAMSDSDHSELPVHKGLTSSLHDSEEETDTDTPLSSQQPNSSQGEGASARLQRMLISREGERDNDNDDDLNGAESDKENAIVEPLKPLLARRSVRAGFIIDSDSE